MFSNLNIFELTSHSETQLKSDALLDDTSYENSIASPKNELPNFLPAKRDVSYRNRFENNLGKDRVEILHTLQTKNPSTPKHSLAYRSIHKRFDLQDKH